MAERQERRPETKRQRERREARGSAENRARGLRETVGDRVTGREGDGRAEGDRETGSLPACPRTFSASARDSFIASEKVAASALSDPAILPKSLPMPARDDALALSATRLLSSHPFFASDLLSRPRHTPSTSRLRCPSICIHALNGPGQRHVTGVHSDKLSTLCTVSTAHGTVNSLSQHSPQPKDDRTAELAASCYQTAPLSANVVCYAL
jgi:hypothetical protein